MKKFLALLYIFFLFLIPSALYANAPIKILLVPGHDNEVWGAQYGNTKEADMNLALGTNLFNSLQEDKRFQVHITRDKLGYTKEFNSYFTNQQVDISAFKKNAKKEMLDKIISGFFIKKIGVPHLSVSEDISLKLYGINKWANENNIDAVIHIHFNDYPRKTKWTKGKYKGFVIYMPEEQMANAKESENLAKKIFTQLNKKYITSTYEKEKGGLIPDQTLIALGANGTLNASVRSVLIEYGYIYIFGNSSFRHKSYKTMAKFTATGIKNYFFVK